MRGGKDTTGFGDDLDTYYVYTYTVAVNVTLSINDDVIARARELATRRGTSVNQLIRDYLEELTSDISTEEALAELEELWRTSSGSSAGKRWTREEIHERGRLR